MHKRTIMIVDDDKECLEETAEMLKDAGYEIETHSTEQAALQAIHESAPDIILLDIKFADNGKKLAREIKMSGDITSIPIIVISGSLDEDTMEAFIEATGVDDVLEKPVNPLDIIASLETHLK